MNAARPLFSIVIVCKNPGPTLAAALESVWQQRGTTREVIVIDGGSTDGTCERLERHRAQLDVYTSEPDRGVYDAMNKGVAAARGDWVLFLGADDRLADPTVLADVACNFNATEAATIAGEAAYDDGRIYRLRARPNPVARNFVHHQAAFYRRSIFSELGGFDDTLRVMADYDLNLRLWKMGARFKALPVRVAECGSNGLSDSGRWRGYREEIAVRHRHFPAWRCTLWDAATVARFLRKQIVRRRRSPHG